MKRFVFIAASIVALALGACSEFRSYSEPAPPQGLAEMLLTRRSNNRFAEAEPVAQWWLQLDDDMLKSLIIRALENNKDIDIAMANMLAARAVTRETGFDRFPTIDASAAYSRERITKSAAGSSGDRTSNAYEAGFDTSWELDLLGRVSSGIQASEAEAQAAEEDFRDAAVMVAAETARTYIDLRGAQHRLNIARRNVKNQQATYDLTRRLGEGGRSNALDEARAKTQLELTKSTLPTLQALVASASHRLSVLTGQVPDALLDELTPVRKLPSIPSVINVGKAQDLLRRRPDIRSAERNLAASVARYNIAVADLYPSVNILGTLGFSATNLSSFARGSAVQGTVGPSITWAAFDLGRVHAQIDQRDALSLAALADYEKTVLESLEELQNAIIIFAREEERRETLRSAAMSSASAASLARQRFEAGVDSFLNVLDAERTQLEAEDSLAQSEITAAVDLIAIYKALGGGWENISPKQKN